MKAKKGFCGLCIELKKEGHSPFKKDGNLKKDSTGRNENQFKVLTQLRIEGYKAEYGIGFEHAKGIIDEYLK